MKTLSIWKKMIFALLCAILAANLAPAASSPSYAATMIVDNADSGFTVLSGTWSTSTITPGYHGSDYRSAREGTGAGKVRWTPVVAEAGNYKVYAKYPSSANRASNAPYTVTHSRGSDTVTVNQQLNGGQWMLLGTYPFAAGSSGFIELSDDANGFVIADAIKLEREMIVDNSDAGFSVSSGAWSVSTITYGYYGTDYRTSSSGTGSSKFRWTPTVDTSGQYNVYVWYTSAANRATNAPFTIHHDGGSSTVPVNQRENGGKWVLLGNYSFAAGTSGYVELSNNANGFVIADAVKLEPYTGAFFKDIGVISTLDHAMPSIIAIDDDTVTISAQIRYTTTVPGGHHEKGAADIVTFRSTSRGDSWGQKRYIYQTAGINGDGGYSSVLAKDGAKLLNVYAVGPQNWSSSQLLVHQRESLDGGNTWGPETTPTILNNHSNAKPTNGGKGYQFPSGRIVIPGRMGLLYSDNGGSTWTATPEFTGTVETKVQPLYVGGAMTDTALVPWRTKNVSYGSIDRVKIEGNYEYVSRNNHSFVSNNNFGFVRYDKNTLLMTLTKTSSPTAKLYIRKSTDEGLTWTNEKEISASAPNARYSDIAVMPDGTIVVVFMQDSFIANNGSPLRVVKFNMDWLMQ